MKDRNQRRPRALAAELHADDGVDPRTAFARTTSHTNKNARKSLQLCKEAARALQTALACDLGHPVLNDLEMLTVEPVAGSSRLRVTLRPTTIGERNVAEIARRVDAVSGFLRAAVAAAIHRRRAPELCFVVQPPIGGAA